MFIACWSVKGGSGTTVVAAALALLAARAEASALLADLAGDAPATLGLPEPSGPGLDDWLTAPAEVGPEALGRLELEATPGLRLLPRGTAQPGQARRAGGGLTLAAALAADARPVVVDAGTFSGPSTLDLSAALDVAASATISLLVLRPCYLALRRAVSAPVRASGVVVVSEPDRALGAADVEQVLGIPVRAVIPIDPAVGRAVDAGLLASRLPRTLERNLRNLA